MFRRKSRKTVVGKEFCLSKGQYANGSEEGFSGGSLGGCPFRIMHEFILGGNGVILEHKYVVNQLNKKKADKNMIPESMFEIYNNHRQLYSIIHYTLSIYIIILMTEH